MGADRYIYWVKNSHVSRMMDNYSPEVGWVSNVSKLADEGVYGGKILTETKVWYGCVLNLLNNIHPTSSNESVRNLTEIFEIIQHCPTKNNLDGVELFLDWEVYNEDWDIYNYALDLERSRHLQMLAKSILVSDVISCFSRENFSYLQRCEHDIHKLVHALYWKPHDAHVVFCVCW